jgi:hypothetical protein
MKKLKILTYTFSFLIVIYFAFGFVFLPIILKNQIIKNLDENLSQKTTIEKIEFNPLNFHLKIHDLKISDSNNKPVLSFNELFVDFLANESIKKQNINIKDISLKDAFLNYNFISEDKKTQMQINSKSINLDLNSLELKKETISVKDIKLTNSSTNIIDKINNLEINAKNINFDIFNILKDNSGFKIEKTNINEPNISITLAKKESINTTVKEQKTEKAQEINPPLKLDIGPINISNAIFSFEDKNLPIPFKTTVSKLNGEIDEFKNTNSSKTKLEVKGIVDEYGVAKITGLVDANNIKVLTDINMIFNNIAVKNFTPYSSKFVGREIKSGKLDLDLKYNIQKSNLEAKNSIIISQLELGDKIENPDALSLPLDIAIALLKDSNGIINIDLPISGNVDNPEFSITPILWQGFTNLITKVITAPFSLLASIFNFSEDEIKTVKFDVLENEIGPIQKESLDKIAQILKSKKELAIEITASYDVKIEAYAKQKQNYLAKKNDDKNLKEEEIEALILKEEIKTIELEKIAKNRALNISKYLKTKGIKAKQIILTNKIETNSSSINLNISKSN